MRGKLALALGMACWLAGVPLASRPAAADRPASAPALSVKTLAGDEFDLSAQRGHVVVVHFWATWCPPCIKEMPELETFYEQYQARGVQVIALSQDRARDLDEVHHMVHHMNMKYPVAMAHGAQRNGFGEQNALPVTYVI